jgi:hypothetical protein
MARQTDWRSVLVAIDPDHNRNARVVVEYEFTAPGRGGKELTHERGVRVFRGDYTTRGPYADD